jgi:exosortase
MPYARHLGSGGYCLDRAAHHTLGTEFWLTGFYPQAAYNGDSSMKKQDLTRLGIVTAVVLLTYIPTFQWMLSRWNARDTYYSHGILVPFISAFIIWHKRKVLRALSVSPSTTGWFYFIPAILVHAVSTVLQVGFASGFALIPILVGLVLLFLGKDFLKQLLFPILFLLFMVPAPEVAIVNTSFRLKLFAAQVSTAIIKGLGVPAIREGSLIRTQHASLMVEDPCSGIRSLIALIALGALMAYFGNLSKVKKNILFASSIPIAVSTNIVRITALSMISEIYGEKYATGIYHDTMGILVFVFAFFGLTLVAKVME